MCKLCFDDDIFEISDIELKRKGKSYTVDTLDELKRLYPDDELYFIMGSDMLLTFHRWREPEKILSLATVCAAEREKGLAKKLTDYVLKHYEGHKDRFLVLDFNPIEISSTEIREELSHNTPLLLDTEVEKYIKERGLYI